MNNHNVLRVYVALTILAVTTPLSAQWSSDPSNNLVISQSGNPIPQNAIYHNGCYIFTYYKTSTGVFYLQIFDFKGNPKFSGDGIPICSCNNTPSSDFKIDQNDHIIFASPRIGNDQYHDIVLHKLDLDGNQLWGDDGVTLSISGTDETSPHLVVNPDNSISVCFASFDKSNWQEALMQIYLYRIAEDGAIQWDGKPRLLKDESCNLVFKNLHSLSNGDVLLAYWKGMYLELNQLFLKRIDTHGQDVWQKDVLVVDQCYTLSTRIYQGPDHFLYVSWVKGTMSYIQGITSEGDLLWPQSGVPVVQSTSTSQYSPTIQSISSDGSVFVMWHQNSSKPDLQDLYGQLISQDGEWQWSNKGILIKQGYEAGGFYSTMFNDTIVAIYREPLSDQRIFQSVKAIAIDRNGSFCWPGEIQLNNQRTIKDYLLFSSMNADQAVLFFTEDNSTLSSSRLVAQNIWKDGTLGLKISATDPILISSGIHIYAPCGEGIWIDGVTSRCDVMVYNIQGYCCFQQNNWNADNQTFRIDTQHWSPGVYVVKVRFTSGRTACSKILVQ